MVAPESWRIRSVGGSSAGLPARRNVRQRRPLDVGFASIGSPMPDQSVHSTRRRFTASGQFSSGSPLVRCGSTCQGKVESSSFQQSRKFRFGSSPRGGRGNLAASAEGSRPWRRCKAEATLFPWSFSPDGRLLAYHTLSNSETGSDIGTVTLDTSDSDHPKPGKLEPFLATPFG
jgi:hypothetical protein